MCRSLSDRVLLARVEIHDDRAAAVVVGLVVTTDDNTGHVVGDFDGLASLEWLFVMWVSELTPAELRAVECFDLPPVRVAVLAVIVMMQFDSKIRG